MRAIFALWCDIEVDDKRITWYISCPFYNNLEMFPTLSLKHPPLPYNLQSYLPQIKILHEAPHSRFAATCSTNTSYCQSISLYRSRPACSHSTASPIPTHSRQMAWSSHATPRPGGDSTKDAPKDTHSTLGDSQPSQTTNKPKRPRKKQLDALEEAAVTRLLQGLKFLGEDVCGQHDMSAAVCRERAVSWHVVENGPS